MNGRPRVLVVICMALLLLGLPGAASAHPWHPAAGSPAATIERVVAPTGAAPGPVNDAVVPHHPTAPPLALAAGALALLAQLVVRRRRLALGLALVVAAAGFEGVLHAALHLHHVAHSEGLTIGAAAAAPTALGPNPETPAAPTLVLLGPAPELRRDLGAGIGHASRRGRAPPALAA